MRIRVLPVIVVLLLAALFAVVNWTTFTTPQALNLGVATVNAPLGMIMLGIVALLAVMYIGSVVAVQSVALLESRRLGRELQVQRDLADKAEASRFTELRDFMSAEMLRVTSSHDDLRVAMLARMEQAEARSRVTLEESVNTLSAYIGELEDRLDRRAPSTLPPDLNTPVRSSDFRTR